MLVFKALLGLLLGAVIGFVGGVILGLVVWIVVGVAASNSATGEHVANIVFLLVWLAGAVMGLAFPVEEEARREADRRVAERNAIESQRVYLSDLLAQSQRNFQSIPSLVTAAQQHLDRAQHEFADGAFAPFWDQIEHAANKLAMYQQQVQTIDRIAVKYQQGVPTLPMSMPSFSLPISQLPDARPATTRLASLVRKAQKDFHFATIYEQRKTNRILIAGFGTLASAISELGDMISSSLDDLSSTLHVSLDNILRKQDEQTSMLDNIQRRRKPKL